MVFFDCPRGHRVDSETRVLKARACLVRWILPLETEVLKNPTATARNGSREDRTLCQRRSSCLWFQIVGVETDLLLPDDQHDGGNLPRQGQARHRGLPSLGQQSLIEIAAWSTTAADSCCCTLKDIFEVVVVVLIRPRSVTDFLERFSCPSTTRYCALSCVSNPRPL